MNIEKTLSALRNQTELDNLEEINILRICLSKYHKDINYQCDICKDTDFPNFGIFMDHCYKEHLPLLYLKSNNWGIMSLYKYNFIQINNGSKNDEYYKNRLSKAFVYFSNDFELRFRCNMCEGHDFFNFEEVLEHFHKDHPHSFDFENELVYMILNIGDDKKYKRESQQISNSNSRARRSPPQRVMENNIHEEGLRTYNRDDEFYDKNRPEIIRRPNKSSFDIRQHVGDRVFPVEENRNTNFRLNEYQPERRPTNYRSPVERTVREQPFFGPRNLSLPIRGKMYPEERIDNAFARPRNTNVSIFDRLPSSRNEIFNVERESPLDVRRLSNSLFSQNPSNLRNYGNPKSLMEREQSQRDLHSSFRGILPNPSLPRNVDYFHGSTTKTFTNELAGGHVVKKDPGNSFSAYLGRQIQTASHPSNTQNTDNKSNGSTFKTSSNYPVKNEPRFPIKNNTTPVEDMPASKKVKMINSTNPNSTNRTWINQNVVQNRVNAFVKEPETAVLAEQIVSLTNIKQTQEGPVVRKTPKSKWLPDSLDLDDENERMFPEENDVLRVIEIKYRNATVYSLKCLICEQYGKTFPQIISHVKSIHSKIFPRGGRGDYDNFYLYSEDVSYTNMGFMAKAELREKVLDMRAAKKAELRQEHNLDHVKLPKVIQFTGDWIELAVMKCISRTGKFLFICDICLEISVKTIKKYIRHVVDNHVNCLSSEQIAGKKTGTLILAINNVNKYSKPPPRPPGSKGGFKRASQSTRRKQIGRRNRIIRNLQRMV